MAELDEQDLLAEIARLAAALRSRALARGDHGLAVTARNIADQAAIGSWGLGAVMGEDGFAPEAKR
jgi:hypothetical protein